MRAAIVVTGACLVLLATGCSRIPEADLDITMTEFAIAAATQVASGPSVWSVTNTGETHHTLSVCPGRVGECDEANVDQRVLRKEESARDPDSIPAVTDALVLGATWNMVVEVDLPPGSYRLWCGVPNHAAKGMDTALTVT